MAKSFDIDKFNRILKSFAQTVCAESISVNEIRLSNGVTMTTKRDIRLCKKRVMSGHAVWKEEFDSLYSTDITVRLLAEKTARAVTSKNGGISCQAKHSNKIKENLNNGTPWNKGMKGNYPYSLPVSDGTKKKISLANQGIKNGMYGSTMSLADRQHRSKIMKEKILAGTFTPNSNNRNTHWDSWYSGKMYRSSWEALYEYFDQDAEYETVRIPYTFNDIDCVYIVDFVNHSKRQLIEVKPAELLHDKKTKAKLAAAASWSKQNNYVFIIADKDFLIAKGVPESLENFDASTQNKIRKLYEIS
jgi:hypothetical protein